MHELEGKRLRHIKEPFSNGKRVVKVENDTVYFEDNGRAPLSAIRSSFEEVVGVNETYKPSSVNSAMTSRQDIQNIHTNQNMSEDIDPSNFFSSNSSTLLELAEQIKNIDYKRINQGGNGYVSQAQPSLEFPIDQEIPFDPNDPRIIKNLNPSTIKNIQQNINQNQNQNRPLPPTLDPAVLAQFGGRVDEGGQVRQVNTDTLKEELQNTKAGMSKEQSDYINKEQAVQSSFPKMKKNTKVTLNLVVEEMIPNPESIKNMNELFEESIIEVLAKEMTQQFLKDPKKVETMFEKELEKIVYKKKPIRKTSIKPKPKPKTNITKKDTVKTNTKKE